MKYEMGMMKMTWRRAQHCMVGWVLMASFVPGEITGKEEKKKIILLNYTAGLWQCTQTGNR